MRDARPTSGAGAPRHLALRPIDLVGLGLAAAMIVVIARAVNEQNDFTAFYAAAKAWRLGRPVPNAGPLDLNPPTFSILFAPLTFLPLHAARVAWIVLSAAAAVDALRRIGRHCQLGARAMWWLSCACVALEPCVFAWGLGQVTWILLWLVTRAWILGPRSPAAAGVWLGAAVAIKPPLALMAILLPAGIAAPAAATAVAASAMAFAFTGAADWHAWLVQGRQVDWLAWWPNMSAWGVAARVHAGGLGPVRLQDLPGVSFVAIGVITVALAIVCARATGSRRWLLAGLWSLTASPLGWTYYLPILIGPAVATPPASLPALSAALVLLAVPTNLVTGSAGQGLGLVISGSMYSAALALLWLAWRTD